MIAYASGMANSVYDQAGAPGKTRAHTKSDTVKPPINYVRGVWVSVAGDLCYTDTEGVQSTIPDVPVGRYVAGMQMVLATGTTATVTHVFGE